MSIKSITNILLVILLSIVPNYAAAKITLLDESSQSLTLELNTPTPVISEENQSGDTYHVIHIPGMGTVEQLPFLGTLIGVPSDALIHLEILDSETEIMSGYQLAFNTASDRYQPANPVKIGLTGYIREQRVAQIQFFPVLYNQVTKNIKFYKRLRVKIHFSNTTRTAKTLQQDSPAFDKMLHKLLLNSTTANRRSRASTRNSCPPPQQPALKLTIDKTGVYALSYYDFQSLGLDISVLDSRQIEMSHQGQPVPIFIDGEENGVFGPEDVLYFSAMAANGPYTRSNVYRLYLNEDGGSRLNFRNVTYEPTKPEITEFTQTTHVEENHQYWSRMPNGAEKDHLFWAKLDPEQSLNMPVNVYNLAPNRNATVRVKLQGKTDDTNFNPNHHTKILLNGVEIHDSYWKAKVDFLQEVTIPQSQLREGENTVSLVSVADTGANVDILYVNWLEIEYTATTTAVSDLLAFNVPGTGQHNFTLTGFTRPELLVLDVTELQQIVPILGAAVSTDDAGGYKIQYSDNLDGSKTYYAFSLVQEHILKPAAINFDIPTTRLKSPCNRADYFIIHHDSFNVDALQNLVAARGLQVMAIPVSDIYDEFNHGMPDPQAIKDFLTYAYENYTQPSPAYVVLVGDANQDTLNELGHGINYVPTHAFYTGSMGETASDNWFVSISGDDNLPDMFQGRIPVRTQMELNAVVNKLSRYPQISLSGWQRNILFVADDEQDFENLSERLIDKHLADYTPKRVYLRQQNADAAKQNIIQNLRTGAILTNYTGHGSVSNWAGEFMFESKDVPSLNNRDRFTFVLALNCLNGWFSYYEPFFHSNDSLAEAFLKGSDEGAIGVFAPSGLGFTTEHESLANEFFKRLFQNKETEIGPLTTATKITATMVYGISTQTLETYILFGDPGLHLRLE